ncbi:MAG TPA: hypothetical protein VJ203_07265 [Bacteroidales bacterium]|nr:hypothetical protein [Bacteroidales bacterium]
MILDIKRTILRKNLANLITTMVMLIAVVVLLFVPFHSDLIKGLSNNLLAMFFAVAYVINAFYNTFRNYNYIYFSDESDKLVLRYFSPNIFTSRKNSIEIPKKEFAGFELKSVFMRYREKLILHRRTGKGIAKYPEVSITALSADERYSLLFTLNQLKNRNEK